MRLEFVGMVAFLWRALLVGRCPSNKLHEHFFQKANGFLIFFTFNMLSLYYFKYNLVLKGFAKHCVVF